MKLSYLGGDNVSMLFLAQHKNALKVYESLFILLQIT